MHIDIGTEQLILFEDMTRPNNIAIIGEAGSGKTHQVLEIAKQVNPCKVIIISDHPEDYPCNLPNIEIHSITDFIVDSSNAIVVFDCPLFIHSMYEYVKNISVNSRFRNSILITLFDDMKMDNSILMNCKYIIKTSVDKAANNLKIWDINIS